MQMHILEHAMSLTLVSHDLCPYVQRAAIALLEKGIPFERSIIDLSAKPDWDREDIAARKGAVVASEWRGLV